MSKETDVALEALKQFASIKQLAHDVFGERGLPDDVRGDVMERLMECVDWSTVNAPQAETLLIALYDAVNDDATRAALAEVARDEHREVCACCRKSHALGDYVMSELKEPKKTTKRNGKAARS